MQHTIARTIEIVVHDDPASATMGVYLARPAAPGRLFRSDRRFELFGLTGYIRDITDRIVALGYVAIAPDFYHRASPGIEVPATAAGRSTGFELARDLGRADALRDLRSAMTYLRDAEQFSRSIGMVGCSFGGHIAYLAATQLDLAATAAFYTAG